MSTGPPNGRTWRVALAIAGTILHAVLAFAVIALYLTYVASAKRTFNEFGLMLSPGTQLVIRFSNIVAEYWWLAVFASPVLAVLDFVVIAVLDARRRFAAVSWIAAFALGAVTVIALTVMAIQSTMAALREALVR